MVFKRFFDPGLAHASYLIGCAGTGEAFVVDPHRDLPVYLQAAETEGLKIVGVTETHIHADFLSGSKELAEICGATLYLSDEGDQDWKYAFAGDPNVHLLKDGARFETGAVQLQAIHTPGHTPEHLTFILTDQAAGDLPLAALTGDFIFVGDVGRPDLLESVAGVAGTAVPGAIRLFESLQRFRSFAPHLLLWPGHGAGSACGKALGSAEVTTLGYEREANWAFRFVEQREFVQAVLEGQPDAPRYFAHMKRLNKQGPPRLSDRPQMERTSGPVDGTFVLDVRPGEEFQTAHLRGSQNIPLCKSFVAYAGWLAPYDQPISLVAGSEANANRARRELTLIGIDQVLSWSGTEAVQEALPDRLERTDYREAGYFSQDADLIDVRSAGEFAEGHLKGARHIPYGRLAERIGEIPKGLPVQVYCYSGERSAIAASLLQRLGVSRVTDLRGGLEAIQAREQRTPAPA